MFLWPLPCLVICLKDSQDLLQWHSEDIRPVIRGEGISAVWRNPCAGCFILSFPWGGHTEYIPPFPQQWKCSNMCVKFIRDLVPVYFWGGLCRYSSMYQNSIFPEGKRVFSINNIVCTNNLGATGHHYQLGIVGIFLKSKFLVTSQRPALLTGLSEDSSLRSSILTFLHNG